jgi:hypothetical protein
MSLLTYQNAKTIKGEDLGYLTGILYLAPSDLSGKDLCPKASKGCREACLFSAGRGRFKSVFDGRMRKTLEYLMAPDEFFENIKHEIGLAQKKAARFGLKLCIRLNGTSDLVLEVIAKGLFEAFPDVQFYDYTKISARFKKPLPSNYHLTFSRSKSNSSEALELLSLGHNVAIVFDVKRGESLPKKYREFKVIDGDIHDLRFLDKRGVVVGLRAKGEAKKDISGFVVKAA